MSEGGKEKREGGQRDKGDRGGGGAWGEDNEAFDEDFLGSICGSLHE